MSGKWTKGPWKVGFYDGSGPEYITSNSNMTGAETPAKVRWGCSCCESTSPLTETEIANANLIAAAPEMYEALDALLKCGGISSRKAGDKPSKAVWQAICALKKARGEK